MDTLSLCYAHLWSNEPPFSASSGLAYTSIADTVRRLRVEGLSRGRGGRGVLELFFSGVQPRVMWISIGGFVFFGAYERAKALFQSIGL